MTMGGQVVAFTVVIKILPLPRQTRNFLLYIFSSMVYCVIYLYSTYQVSVQYSVNSCPYYMKNLCY